MPTIAARITRPSQLDESKGFYTLRARLATADRRFCAAIRGTNAFVQPFPGESPVASGFLSYGCTQIGRLLSRLQTMEMSGQIRTASGPAELGSLAEEVASDIALLRQFMVVREQRLSKLFGRKLRRSAARDELLRLIILAFSQGQLLRASAYVRQCAHYATGPSIRREIDLLTDANLVFLKPDPSHRRAYLVVPTKKLVDFYNHEMPRLREEVKKILIV